MNLIELVVVPPWTTACLDDPAWRGQSEHAIGDEMERRVYAAADARKARRIFESSKGTDEKE